MTTPKSAKKIEVFEAADWTCCECSERIPDPPGLVRSGLGSTDLWRMIGNHMTIDHIVPKAFGGTNAMWNLQAMCYICNNGKGDGARPNSLPGQSKKKQKRKRRANVVNDPRLVGRVAFRSESG